ncbi:hypothetical protein QFC24_002877 [Naganishia onofrii]|uniref:Uncharacterized protein n=1 Tax=Naganishia onofrii TaxID=1851511 RepID=A0ACC2XLL8_9TREE|nr:hypothetical protein QFC24_002877 [Naganishia onofrii]
MLPNNQQSSQHQPPSALESPPPGYSTLTVIRRPPTPFHFPGPPPDDECDTTKDESRRTHITDDIIRTHHTPLSATSHTIRRAASSGISIPVISETQPSTPTTIEYAFPNPFVATASLKARRALNPDYRYIRRPSSNQSEEMSRSSRAGTPSSRVGSGGSRRGSLAANAEEWNGTDSQQRIQQRLVDNAIVIPSPSSPASQNQQRGKRNQPLHREYSAGKLRPALRVVHAEIDAASPRTGIKAFGGVVETIQAGNEIDIRLTDTSRRGKPLPPRPPSTTTVGNPRRAEENIRHSRTFSLQALRQSLPSIGSRKRSPSNQPSRMLQVAATGAHESHEAVRLPPDAFPSPSHPSRLPSFPASATRSVGSETHGPPWTQPPSTVQHRAQAAALKDPADNLNIYLRLAHLPKWTRWIDPDRNVESRWHNTSNWGTGRTFKNNKDPQSSNVASEATDGRSGMVSSHGIGEMSGRARTIDRLVQSVVTNQMCSAADTAGSFAGRDQQQRQVQSLSSSSASLAANTQILDPGKHESAARADQVAGGRRFLKSWEVRRGFLDGIENCKSLCFSGAVPRVHQYSSGCCCPLQREAQREIHPF